MRDTNRRTFVKLAGAAAIAPAVAGCTGNGNGDDPDPAADEEEEADEPEGDFIDDEPDYDGWFDDVDNYEGTLDRTGEDEVVVMNGTGPQGFFYDPPAIAVDPGTTVVWEWTGEGGSHTVTGEDGDWESELVGEEGATYERTFEEEGAHRYYCEPHRGVGQKGVVVVQ